MSGILASKLRVLVDVHMLLKLLEGVLGAMRQGVEAGAVQVGGGRMVREHVARGEGVVSRKAVQRVGKHLERWVGQTCQNVESGEKVEKEIREEVPSAPYIIDQERRRSMGRVCGEAMRSGTKWRGVHGGADARIPAESEDGFRYSGRWVRTTAGCHDGGVIRMAAPSLRRREDYPSSSAILFPRVVAILDRGA